MGISTSVVWDDSLASGVFENSASWVPAVAPVTSSHAAYFNSSNPPPSGDDYSTSISSSITTGHFESGQRVAFQLNITTLPNFGYKTTLGDSFTWILSSDTYSPATCALAISRPSFSGFVGTPGNINCWTSLYANSSLIVNSSSTLQSTGGIFASYGSSISFEAGSTMEFPELLNWGLGSISVANSTLSSNSANNIRITSREAASSVSTVIFSGMSTLLNSATLSSENNGSFSFVDASFNSVEKSFIVTPPIEDFSDNITLISLDNSIVPIVTLDSSIRTVVDSSSTIYGNIPNSQILLEDQSFSGAFTLEYLNFNLVETQCFTIEKFGFGPVSSFLKFSSSNVDFQLADDMSISENGGLIFSGSTVDFSVCGSFDVNSITPAILSSISIDTQSTISISDIFHPIIGACDAFSFDRSIIQNSVESLSSILIGTDSTSMWSSGTISSTLLSVGSSSPSMWSPQPFSINDTCSTQTLSGDFEITFGPTFSKLVVNGDQTYTIPSCTGPLALNNTFTPTLKFPAFINTPFLTLSSNISSWSNSSYFPPSVNISSTSYARNSTCFLLTQQHGVELSSKYGFSVGATDFASPGTTINLAPGFNAEVIAHDIDTNGNPIVNLNFLSNLTVQPVPGTESVGDIANCPKSVIFSPGLSINIQPSVLNSSAYTPVFSIANTTLAAFYSNVLISSKIQNSGNLAFLGSSDTIFISVLSNYYPDASLTTFSGSQIFISDQASVWLDPVLWNSTDTDLNGIISISGSGRLLVYNIGSQTYNGPINFNNLVVTTTRPAEISCQCNSTSCSLADFGLASGSPVASFSGKDNSTLLSVSFATQLEIDGQGALFESTFVNISGSSISVINGGTLQLSESHSPSTFSIGNMSTLSVNSPTTTSTVNTVNFDTTGILGVSINNENQPISLTVDTITVAGGTLVLQISVPVESIVSGFDPSFNPQNYSVLTWTTGPTLTDIDVTFPNIQDVLTSNFCEIAGHSFLDTSNTRILIWFTPTTVGCNEVVDGNDDQQFNNLLNFRKQPLSDTGIVISIIVAVAGFVLFGAIWIYRTRRQRADLEEKEHASTSDASDMALLLAYADD